MYACLLSYFKTKCSVCGEMFVGLWGLGVHKLAKHVDVVRNQIVCDECGKICVGEFGLASHKRRPKGHRKI